MLSEFSSTSSDSEDDIDNESASHDIPHQEFELMADSDEVIELPNATDVDCNIASRSTSPAQTCRRLHIIRCMKSCVPPKDLVTIYHALITSILCYASPAFGLLPTTLLTRLARFQRIRAHRLICGQSACQCSGFPSLNDRFADSATDLLLRAEANCSHPLHRRIPARLPSTNQFRNPVCLTNRRLNSFFPWACRLHNSNFHK